YFEPCTLLMGACRRAPLLGRGLPPMRTSEVQPRASFSASSPSSARLAWLIEISRLLTSAVDIDHLLGVILKTSSQLVGSEDRSLLLPDPATQAQVLALVRVVVSSKCRII